MKCSINKLILLVIFIAGLPGCGCRIISWGRSVVNQGCPVPDYAEKAHDYVRATSVYNQFSLLARFDALWLHDEVVKAYACAWGCKHGATAEAIDEYYTNEINNNRSVVRFYVLSLFRVPLDGNDPVWCVFLDIDGCTIMPSEIKKVEIPLDYLLFFGQQYSHFKVPYLLTFELNNVPVDPAEASCMKLIFRSSIKEAELVWNIDDIGPQSDKVTM
jgi:hypothetical protein